MAYDWSGNNVRQQRYDRVVMVAIAALVLTLSMLPLALRQSETKHTQPMQMTSADKTLQHIRM